MSVRLRVSLDKRARQRDNETKLGFFGPVTGLGAVCLVCIRSPCPDKESGGASTCFAPGSGRIDWAAVQLAI